MRWCGVRSASDYESSSHKRLTLAPGVRATRRVGDRGPQKCFGRQDESPEGASVRRDSSEPTTGYRVDATTGTAALDSASAYRAAGDVLDDEFRLARLLIDTRSRAGLSQAELAVRMKTLQSYIARIEGGVVAAEEESGEAAPGVAGIASGVPGTCR